MRLGDIQGLLHSKAYSTFSSEGIDELRPCQTKAIQKGIFEHKNLLICTPTASGKTLCAEFAFLDSILNSRGKAIYIVPLKALANDKYKDFKRKYEHCLKIALSIGNMDSADPYLAEYDLIICTAEKLDSLLRHHAPWLMQISTVIVDEVHLINDPERGPTLEILLTMLRQLLKNVQIIALSATIGNPKELAAWLNAGLVEDLWRPVELRKGVYIDNTIEFV